MKPVISMIALCAWFCYGCNNHKEEIKNTDWPKYGGNNFGSRYSPLDQINKSNVNQLKVAWVYETGDNKDTTKRPVNMQCQPIVVNGILYGVSPRLKAFAVEAKSGKEIWRFDPFKNADPMYHPSRGVTYWESGNDKRIIYTAGKFIYALDALTGKLIDGFGDHGKVDLYTGLGEGLDHDVHQQYVTQTTPGVVYKNIYIMGTMATESGDAAPGPVRAFDVVTGKLKWVFHTIPLPGEYGYDTWPPGAYKYMGGANNWSGLTLDEKRGTVYLGTGSPSVDYYGATRPGTNLFANCVLALDAETGKRKWHFQTIHHDLWDRDIPAPPNLLTVKHNGKSVDAVAVSGKDGLVYVLDRDSGKPLFPVTEKPVPTDSTLKGEQPWPTQPYPSKPAPFSTQYITEKDLTDLTPEDHQFALNRYLTTRRGNKFMPPSKQGTIVFGIGGGAEWGGQATDPDGILYVNGNNMPWDLKMMDLAEYNNNASSKGKALFIKNCAVCHGADRKGGGADYPSLLNIGKKLSKDKIENIIASGNGRMPSFRHVSYRDRNNIIKFLLNTDTKTSASSAPHNVPEPTMARNGKNAGQGTETKFPYESPYVSNGFLQFRGPGGYPAIKPPWGTLNAINLNTGEYVWKVPLGEHEKLTRKGIKPTGTENHGGMVVTAGGLVFIAATEDEMIRAFDKDNGKIIWQHKLPAGGFATPITYAIDGKQYVVIAAGGTRYNLKPGGSFIAFALP
ncbi:PQQ-binding-like beta-propeller repeat protein [Mucilaginibacter sp.]|jgi:quinoprotein glucose dehydrogenase|uniref:outer membrane protein assembly factor BamB family protein n=1 Tax=Mucilaginibacter sp. TaxID=1882438 RepID=UPI0035678FBB